MNKLNSAHLLIEAGADVNAVNELRQRPVDLCPSDSPMVSLLNKTVSREINEDNQVLNAAKNLLSSTLEPVAAYEDTIVLICKKVTDEASSVVPPNDYSYNAIRSTISQFQHVSDDYKSAISQVQNYRKQLEENCSNVGHMGDTIEESHRGVSAKLQRRRTANVNTRQQRKDIESNIVTLRSDYQYACDEYEELEKKLNQARQKRDELKLKLDTLTDKYEKLTENEDSQTKNESLMAENQESLQGTKLLIEKGVISLKNLDSSTSDRLLKTSLDYSEFLKKYYQYLQNIKSNFENRCQIMQERIELERNHLKDIDTYELKLDREKISQIIDDYKTNLARFERRKQKIAVYEAKIRDDFIHIKSIVSLFGRDIGKIN